jgi:hypothetical protein
MKIYTALFDGPAEYDNLPTVNPDKAEFIAFMDINEPYMQSGWHCRPAVYHDADPRKRARHHKALAHELFPDEPYTLWVDANVVMGDDLAQFLEYDADIVAMPHHAGGAGNTWVQEIDRCLNNERVMKHVDADRLRAQQRRYRFHGLPMDDLAPENSLFFRKNNERTVKFNETLWEELNTYTIRDQVAFAWARHVSGATLDLLPRHIFQKPFEGEFTKTYHHPKIYYFNPFDRRGLGWAYNNCASIVPDSDCWICFMDFDVMLFPSSIGIVIEDVISKYGTVYDYFTCLTTRVLADWMCVDGKPSGERDLVKLYQLAMRRLSENGTHVSKWDKGFAGYFMLFKKSLWEEIPFPTCGEAGGKMCKVLGIDTEWHRRLDAAGKRMGCIDGLTAVHYYRMAEQHAEHREMLENPEIVKPKIIPDIKATKPIPDIKVKVQKSKSHARRKGRV